MPALVATNTWVGLNLHSILIMDGFPALVRPSPILSLKFFGPSSALRFFGLKFGPIQGPSNFCLIQIYSIFSRSTGFLSKSAVGLLRYFPIILTLKLEKGNYCAILIMTSGAFKFVMARKEMVASTLPPLHIRKIENKRVSTNNVLEIVYKYK